jgi:hypothetical protein
MHALQQACSVFNMVHESSSKSGLRAGNMKFSTQNEELLSMHVIIQGCIILPVCLFIHDVH